MNQSTAAKILMIRTDRIGDVVLSLPMLTVLKEKFPKASISVMVRPYTQTLVSHHPDVDEVLLWEPEGKRTFLQSVSWIREKKFDIAILPYPRFNLALLMFLAGIPLRVGTGYRWYSFLLNRKIYEHRKDGRKHEVEYNLNLLSTIGIEIPRHPTFDFEVPKNVQENIDSFLSTVGLAGEPFVVLHPGSGGSARDWPLENFVHLGDELTVRYGLKIAITGGTNEISLVESIAGRMSSTPVNLAGKFSLEELSALYTRASVFVSNSTGPLHIAALVGTPVVAFYPPIVQCSPVRWGPYTEKKIVFTADNTTCELCHGGSCRSNICMQQITVEDVVLAVHTLIGSS